MKAESQTLSPEQLLSHLDWLRQLSRALVRNEDDADDLAQETAAVALDSAPDDDRPIRPWLAGVARNLARMRARASGRRARREQQVAPPPDVGADAEKLVERVETQRLISELVLELPEPFRTTVLLRYFEGLSAAEIARRLELPAGTVRWRLSRGLATLRQRLDDRYGHRESWHAALLPVASAASTGSLGTVAKGAVIVKTSTKIIAAIAVLVGLLATGYVAGWFGGGDSKQTPTQATNTQTPTQGVIPAGLAPVATSVQHSPGGFGIAAVRGPDPKGGERLEGQVIDEHDRPVGGATVAVDSSPPRSVQTEDDGSFAIDGLLARKYTVEARAGRLYAGPVQTAVGGTEPLILRAKAGATLRVEVRSAIDGKPVAGASVQLRSTLMWTASTGNSGVAVLRGVGTSWRTLVVSAQGFASSTHMITHATSAAEQQITVRLEPGALVVGSVRTESGDAVAGARVWASSVTEPFPVIDPRIDAVVSDDDGNYELAPLPAGSYRLTAEHRSIAQTTTPPVSLAANTAAAEVDIVAQVGGVLEGTVTDAGGKPVAGADVHVSAPAVVDWAMSRSVVAGDDGRYRVEGLPRRALDVVARTEAAASPVARVDLTKQEQRTADLILSVSGTIAGVVRDSGGDPVAEAQVVAEPVWFGDIGERASWRSQAVSVHVVGGDGKFSIAGLVAGTYRIRASRTGADPGLLDLHPGVVAQPGDSEVVVEIPDETAVSGKVALTDGSAPEAFVVRIGESLETPFSVKDGSFSLSAVAGTYNLVVTGPGILTKLVPDIELKAEQVTDVGTITVDKGRSVNGRVIDTDGTPVPGATVVAGPMLTGDGKQLYIESESPGSQRTGTDDRGRFVLSGFDERRLVLVAGHAERGRSLSVSVPRGDNSVEVDLVLVDTGALLGTVTRDGKPLADTVVIANPRGATRSNFFVITGPDGSFVFDQLSSGEYSVMAMLGGGGPKPKDMHTRGVTVEAGQRTPVDIDIESGDIELELALSTDDGKPVPMAQVIVGTGAIPDGDSTMEALRSSYESQMEGALYVRMATGGKARLFGLAAGTYSACVVPIPADPSDRAQMQRVMSELETVPARCVRLGDLRSSPAQKVAITVPGAWLEPPK